MNQPINGSDHLQDLAVQYARQDFPLIRENVSVRDALDIIRREGVGERIVYFYIINGEGKLAGIVPTRRLLTARPQQFVTEIMIKRVITISDRATVQEACEMFVKHKFFAFPIVDDGNTMRGVIDIGFFSNETISVLEKQKIEDVFELIGFGMAQLKGRSLIGVLRYRFPWLLAALVSGVVCVAVANLYQTTIAQHIGAALFLILVLGLSGRVSAQSMTVALQNLHFGGATWTRYFRWLRDEALQTLLLGIACGMLVTGIVWIWRPEPLVSIAIGTCVLLSMLAAGLIGVTTPTVLYATHEESKIAAGPVTHALTYITTVMIFLTVLWAVMS